MRTLRFIKANLLALLLLAATLASSRATIPEPDNVIYGSVVIGSTPITAAQTEVVIEARRNPGGQVVASYRMGSDTALGNYYSLNLKLESVGVTTHTNASQLGEGVDIVLIDSSGVVGQTHYQIGERGSVKRVDFGAPVEDADGNGLPDLWELTYLGSAGNDPSLITANGQTALQNYVAGTDPGDPGDSFRLEIDVVGGSPMVSFMALRAQGPGYTDKTRLYTLESNNNGGRGAWTAVPGFIDVVGDNQTVAFLPSGSGVRSVYRGNVRLAALQAPGAPRLTIQKLPGNLLRLSWPSSSTGFAVQQNSNPQSSNWSNLGLTSTDDGTAWSVTLSVPTGSRFYRLAR